MYYLINSADNKVVAYGTSPLLLFKSWYQMAEEGDALAEYRLCFEAFEESYKAAASMDPWIDFLAAIAEIDAPLLLARSLF